MLAIISYSSRWHEDIVLLSVSSLNNLKTVNKVKSAVENNAVKVTTSSPSPTVSTLKSDFCGGIENSNLPVRILSNNEKAGNNIMITIRATKKFHQKRLSILYDTWLTVVNGSNVFLVTDGEDDEYQKKSKMLG